MRRTNHHRRNQGLRFPVMIRMKINHGNYFLQTLDLFCLLFKTCSKTIFLRLSGFFCKLLQIGLQIGPEN